MAIGIKNYLESIKQVLDAGKYILELVLCLQDLPSELVEKDNKPYVELQGYSEKIDPLINVPVHIVRNAKQKCLIESSFNSVRISFTFNKIESLDNIIANKFIHTCQARANLFQLLRRKPIQGYDLSFLIQASDLNVYRKPQLIEFFIDLLSNIEKDLQEIKLQLGWQFREAAFHVISLISNQEEEED